MKSNFWQELARPIICLAPMEDVTDTVYREIVLGLSDPRYLQVMFAEFAATDGLCHEEGRPRVAERLRVNASERRLLREMNVKLVAQIWGTRPENFRQTARWICEEMEFDGIDINMGCPVRKIVRQGGCSALIDDAPLAKEIVLATKEASRVPVSVKTRTGLKEVVTESWIGHLLETEPAAITLHGRTQKEMSKAPADWLEIAKAVSLRDEHGSATRIIGNGDVLTIGDALVKFESFGVDGVMIGRGAIHDPWLFNHPSPEMPLERRLEVMWRHACLYVQTWGSRRNFANLRKFFKIYVSGFPGASGLRARLMTAGSLDDLREILAGRVEVAADLSD
jgi:tRNA-dihydrouridine synthase